MYTVNFPFLTSEAIIRSIRDFNGDPRIFLFYQLLIEIFLHLPQTPEFKKTIHFILGGKPENYLAQQKIFQKRMENYQPDQAISS